MEALHGAAPGGRGPPAHRAHARSVRDARSVGVTRRCQVATYLLAAGLSSLFTALLSWRWPFSVPGDPADTDYTAVGCAITTISSNLTEMSKGVKLLAALMDDEVGSGEDLLRAARTLAGAVSDLLKAVQPTSGEVSSWGKQPPGSDATGAALEHQGGALTS